MLDAGFMDWWIGGLGFGLVRIASDWFGLARVVGLRRRKLWMLVWENRSWAELGGDRRRQIGLGRVVGGGGGERMLDTRYSMLDRWIGGCFFLETQFRPR